MNSKLLLAFVFAAVAAAAPQTTAVPTDVPACNYACIDIVASVTSCSLTDVKCLCADLEGNRLAWQCLLGVCTTADLAKTLKLNDDYCAANGYVYSDAAIAYITGSASSAASLPTSSSTGTVTRATSTGSSGGSSGISTGAIVGIAIGAAVIVIAIAIGAFLVMRRRRRRPTAVVVARPPNANAQYPSKPGMVQQQVQQNPMYQGAQQQNTPMYQGTQQQQNPAQFYTPTTSPPPQQQNYTPAPVYELDPGAATTGSHEVAGDSQWQKGKK
ncbi:hypothetical protein BZA05DRAFT_160055 [Tricharina praecox]|uniref:uncharacterized protein n=1 Tax=Tricharina praecox TaxID=43433 RepID=UPI0022200641|nr:uncharacterized protein BZA05DRAFT_160055 [Tricharina praecox]KAI5856826.1 hypothetical protein BZA05DRAFT_160055 [Tricharina praecox]